MRILRSLSLAFLTAAALAVPLPAHADFVSGGTVSVSVNSLTFTARQGFRNLLSVSQDASGWWVSELGGLSISVGPGCAHVAGYPTTTARCTGNLTNARIDLGDWDDELTLRVNLSTQLYGGDGNDLITGGYGQDYIDGGIGADTMNGGIGLDTVSYQGRTRPVTASLDGATGNDGEAGERDTIGTDVENLWGGSGWDYLYGSGVRNFLYGLGGWDQLYGLGGNDYLDGGDGDDTMDGGTGADTLFGGNGTDTADYSGRTAGVQASLDGVANDGEYGEGDSISSNTENLTGGRGADVLVGNDVRNVLRGGPGGDALIGNGGNDALLGEDGGDALYGGDGDDWLAADRHGGAAYADFVDGGDGTDATSYEGRTGTVYVLLDNLANDGYDGEGDNVLNTVETVYGGSGTDWLIGSALNETLVGGSGPDYLDGGGGKDVLRGGPDDDTIVGGAGNDYLFGDAGVDWLSGGADYDSCEAPDGGYRNSCEAWL